MSMLSLQRGNNGCESTSAEYSSAVPFQSVVSGWCRLFIVFLFLCYFISDDQQDAFIYLDSSGRSVKRTIIYMITQLIKCNR